MGVENKLLQKAMNYKLEVRSADNVILNPGVN